MLWRDEPDLMQLARRSSWAPSSAGGPMPPCAPSPSEALAVDPHHGDPRWSTAARLSLAESAD